MGDTIKNKSHQKLIKIYATLVDDESSIDDTYDALRSLAKVVKELKRERQDRFTGCEECEDILHSLFHAPFLFYFRPMMW